MKVKAGPQMSYFAVPSVSKMDGSVLGSCLNLWFKCFGAGVIRDAFLGILVGRACGFPGCISIPFPEFSRCSVITF